jgi:hypothetical protein
MLATVLVLLRIFVWEFVKEAAAALAERATEARHKFRKHRRRRR